MQQTGTTTYCPFMTNGTLVAGRYRIVRTLGRGGMSSVYLAEDEVLGETEVAIKILSQSSSVPDSAAERFLREVRLTHKINHENVVRTFDFGQEGGMRFYTMEYLRGQTLRALCTAESVPIPTALKIAAQICRGLAAIHAVGVIHRDLKPDNIMVLDSMQVKITDFGVARGDGSMLTVGPHEILGTIAYLAPETLIGQKVTAAVDFYSLAAIVYELLTGHLPIEEENPALLILKKIETAPVDPREYRADIPDWLAEGLLDLLNPDANQRLVSAQSFIQTLLSQAAAVGSDGYTISIHGEVSTPQTYVTERISLAQIFASKWEKLRSLARLSSAFAVAVAAVPISTTDIAQELEYAQVDNLFALRGPQAPSSEVVIVSIDEPSYLNLNVPMGDAWPRGLHAKLMRRLHDYGAKRVVFDVLFISPSVDASGDAEFAEALSLNETVLGASIGLTKQATANGSFTLEQMIRPVAQFESKAAGLGIVGLPQISGRIRSFYVERSELFPDVPSLAQAASGIPAGAQAPEAGDLINYYGPAATIKRFSYYDVVSDETRIPREVFKNKIVFVGLNLQSRTGPSQREAFETPFDSSTFGTEIHATATSNYLQNDWISHASDLLVYAVAFTLVLSTTLVLSVMGGFASVATFVGIVTVILGVQLAMFSSGFHLPVVAPLIIGSFAGFLLRTAFAHGAARRIRRWS